MMAEDRNVATSFGDYVSKVVIRQSIGEDILMGFCNGNRQGRIQVKSANAINRLKRSERLSNKP